MQFPARFSDLPEYAFPRLRALLRDHPAGGPDLAMTIGEPKHPMPAMIAETVAAHAHEFALYPPNDGTPELRAAIADWVGFRHGVPIDPETGVMPLNGTREGLFNAALALSPEEKDGRAPAVLMPNPFYQAYGAAALAVGAEPVLVPATAATGFLPDYASLPGEVLDRATLCYLCSPSNPQGAIASEEYWRDLIALAERHDFRIVADECYGEIYRETPPPGGLAMAARAGADPERVLIVQSLSKRSNAPGLRSGFAAGGPRSIAALKRLRAYGGAPLPLPLQRAATALWRDEAHVEANRALYRAKFDLADRILGDFPGYVSPRAGFFLWLDVGDGEAAALRLWRETGVRVLPGGYLGRAGADGVNPGAPYIRVALVAPEAEVARGLGAIRDTLGAGRFSEKVV
ncbi:aminotransferase class I/II-fold pyridoxal phosphate-dependent enzyme [Amaricoccus solimangrovi]|uniref:Aminotransferase class I/II-fold pyridoxal phosphate-dependent enzyme n=1 Tax=Amaricoccus solimangrovi TaxID=2589815 RepID=A0A501X0E9_9RHOB|nr:aminotransferase class I/II-fold pyridoxal phosphate-dependent enzyme [Amaricoccus solimangrovi]TPE53121.1 aminotransferase class I/II-fold pyridoxal phosphate-dependent enzyme [Amaricoccus solimangrovi]